MDHSCAIQAGSGHVICWGYDPYAAAGQATPPPSVNGTEGTATAIAAGAYHSCAIQAETGNVVCWGFNNDGQANPPAAVDGTTGTATAIVAGYKHSCAIQAATGNVFCWGRNYYGQANAPATLGAASAIAAGGDHTLAIVPEPAAALVSAVSLGSLLALARLRGERGRSSM
jgi:hypothetical protein